MAYNANSEIFVKSKMSRAGFRTVLQNVGSPFAPVADEIAEIIETWPVWGPDWAEPMPLEFWLGICKHEHNYGTNQNSVLHREDTNSWTNARSVRMPGLNYELVTDDFREGEYVKYASVQDSVRDGLWRIQDPTYAYAKQNARTIWKIISIWAPASDGNSPGSYTNDVVISANTWVDRYPTTGDDMVKVQMKTATDRVMNTLISENYEVHDLRGILKGNSNPAYAYRTLDNQYGQGAGGVRYLACHWTGDAFSREFFKNVVHTDYGPGSIIPPDMSVEDEIELTQWYDQYHAGRDGGTWPGIAYGMLIFPSGRIYINFDIGTLSYHAYNANSVSYAISCPNSQGQSPTTPQEIGLNRIIDLITHNTPEVPAAHTDVYGHQELTFLDSRNTTACPGVFKHVPPHWREYDTPTIPYGNLHEGALVFPETGQQLQWGFKNRWLVFEQAMGREHTIWAFGLPLTGELYPDRDNTGHPYTIQVFERSIWEFHADKTGTWYEVEIMHSGRAYAEERGWL